MSEEFTHRLLRAVIGRVCQPLGVHGMQQSVCDCMADLLKQYIMTLGRTAASYSAHANRTEANVSDVFQAFRDLGINISDLEEFTREVESIPPPQPIPRYPVPRSSTHIYHAPSSDGKPAASHRPRTGSLSSEDEHDREHIPPYLPPLPLEEGEEEGKEEGDEMEVADQSDLPEAVTAENRLPPDPTKGLPQLFRSRRLSSDFSEEGDNAGSRRNSVSNGAFTRTPGVLTNESASINTNNERGAVVKVKEEKGGYNEVAMETEKQSLEVKQKVNVFDVAFSKKLTENRELAKPVQPAEEVAPNLEASGSAEAPPTLSTKPIKQEPQPAQPVIFQKPLPRVPPPPLKLMSPTSAEHPNLPTQQPPLSPLTTRSPVQFAGMPRMPVLSPLRAPASGNRHPLRPPGNFGHAASSPLISPPSLRSPVDVLPSPIDALPHGMVQPSTVHAPHVLGKQLPPAQVPFSAHPPAKPFSAQPLHVQVRTTPSTVAISQSSVLPTSAVSVKEEESTVSTEERAIERAGRKDDISEENVPSRSLREVDQEIHDKSEKERPTDLSLREDDKKAGMPVEDVRVRKDLSPTLSASSSSSGSPSPFDKETEFKLPEESQERKVDTVTEKSTSLQPSEEIESDTLKVSPMERLSVSPASMKDSEASVDSTPGEVTAVGETSLQDLEISDDEGLSDEEEEEEEGEREGEEGALAKRPLPPPLIEVKQEEEREGEEYHEGNISAPVNSGKKLMKKESSLTPVSSPASAEPELDADTHLGEEVEDVDFSTQDALSLVRVTKEETDFERGYDQEDRVSSPERELQNISSDESTTAPEPAVASPGQRSEFTSGQEDVSVAGTKVKVLESADVAFSDDGVQDMGTVEEVLEVLEQKFSSDEESEESEEEKERGVVKEEAEGDDGGVVSEIGVVSGEGVMVEDDDDMVETLSAMAPPPPPQASVTTESVPNSSKLVSSDELFGRKPAPPPAPPRLKSLKVSFKRHLVLSLQPEPKPKLRPPSPSPPPPTVTRFLTKAEKKADIVSHQLHHLHGSGAGGMGSSLIVTPGETKSVPRLPPPAAAAAAPHTPSASPTPSPEDELDQPLIIAISRRLLRHPWFSVPTPVEERPRVPSANAIKMKLARFGAPPTPSGGVASGHVTPTPTTNPRKRDRDADAGTTLLVGREVKRSRQESPPVVVQVSSSSSSSSSSSEEEEDSGSEDSVSRSPSPYPPPPHPPHPSHRHTLSHVQHQPLRRAQTPSSVDEEEGEEEEEEDTRALTPASSESGSTLGSGGLKLTISKAVLKQAVRSGQQTTSSSSLAPPLLSTTLFVGPVGGDGDGDVTAGGSGGGGGRGSRRGSKGSRRGRGGAKKGRRGSSSTKPPPPPSSSSSLSIQSSQPKKVKKKDLAGAKPTAPKGPKAIQVQSSNPVIIKLPTKSRSSKSRGSIISSLPKTAATTPAVGSDYHCPECGLRDDGSPMIGCDGCDSWVHWTCAGITREPPEDAKWFCPTCVKSKSEKKKKGRKRKRTS